MIEDYGDKLSRFWARPYSYLFSLANVDRVHEKIELRTNMQQTSENSYHMDNQKSKETCETQEEVSVP